MTYWVLDSWVLSKAIVHQASCPFCVNGTHEQGRQDPRNGAWRGPFARDAAFRMAEMMTRRTTRGCKNCAP